MIEVEIPNAEEIIIPEFNPQIEKKEKAEKAMLEKSVTEELASVSQFQFKHGFDSHSMF